MSNVSGDCASARGTANRQSSSASTHATRPVTSRMCACDASVDVHGDDVNDRCDDQHENERQMQRMPQGEEALVGLKFRNPPRRGQPLIDVRSGELAQAPLVFGDRG